MPTAKAEWLEPPIAELWLGFAPKVYVVPKVLYAVPTDPYRGESCILLGS